VEFEPFSLGQILHGNRDCVSAVLTSREETSTVLETATCDQMERGEENKSFHRQKIISESTNMSNYQQVTKCRDPCQQKQVFLSYMLSERLRIKRLDCWTFVLELT